MKEPSLKVLNADVAPAHTGVHSFVQWIDLVKNIPDKPVLCSPD